MKKKVGIVIADDLEYSPFVKYTEETEHEDKLRFGNDSRSFTVKDADREIEVIGVMSGMGKANSASATMGLIAVDKVDFILNAGLSGAVSHCRIGDIVLGERCVECDFDLTAIGYEPGQKPNGQKTYLYASQTLLRLGEMSAGLYRANLGTGDYFLTDKAKKEYVKTVFGVNAFDMETGAIASVCDKNDIPFLCIRKISDDADDSSEITYREMNRREETCLTEVLLNIISRMIRDDSIWN